jgi:hypothetical protein
MRYSKIIMSEVREIIDSFSEYLITNNKIHTVLDIACGNLFTNKIFLKNDVKVTGIDHDNQDEVDSNFTFIQKDIRDYEFGKNFDLIKTTFFLHFFKPKRAKSIIGKMKEYGEYNLITFLDEGDYFKDDEGFFPSIEEVKELYLDWEIVKIEQSRIEESHPIGNSPEPVDHFHSTITILAKKKSGN